MVLFKSEIKFEGEDIDVIIGSIIKNQTGCFIANVRYRSKLDLPREIKNDYRTINVRDIKTGVLPYRTLEVVLNGNGRNKAEKKIRRQLLSLYSMVNCNNYPH